MNVDNRIGALKGGLRGILNDESEKRETGPGQERSARHITCRLHVTSAGENPLTRDVASPHRSGERSAYLAAIVFGPRRAFFGTLMAGRFGVESIVTASRKRSTA